MKQHDKILITILSIWTFIHCFLILKAMDYPKKIELGFKIVNFAGNTSYNTWPISKTERFYPFTLNADYYDSTLFDIRFYDYTEYFVYIVGAWGLFFIYKLWSKNS
jgi:hypothetical protein